MNQNPAISIITIVYNGLPFLKECIDSVLNQQFTNWELLISDDGSSDGTREYLDSLNDSRIIVFKQTRNLGIFGNLNFLFALSRAPFCQILCQDDYFTGSTSIDTILTYWASAPATLGFARFNHANEKTKGLVQFEKKVVPEIIKAGMADPWFYLFGNIPGNLSNVSLRSSVVADSGWFDQKLPYAGDFEFWSRAARKFDMGVNGALVVFVRSHQGQASSYLNFNGELISQKMVVINSIYQHTISENPKIKFLLKLHGILNYDSPERNVAITVLLKGNKKYYLELKKWERFSLYAYATPINWIVFVLSLGGRLGRTLVAKNILQKLKC